MKKANILCALCAGMLVFLSLGCAEETAPPAAKDQPTLAAPKAAPAAPEPRRAPAARQAGDRVVISTSIPSGNKSHDVIGVEKSTPREVVVGKEFDMKIKLTNLTGTALEQVVLVETLSEQFKVKSTIPEASISGQVIKWSVGTLKARESRTLTVLGTPARTGSLKGCSKVHFRIPNVCIDLTAVKPAVEIAKTAPAEVILCDTITSTIVVKNTGTGSAYGLKVKDSLPAGMNTLDGKRAAVFDIGTLKPGQSKKLTVKARAEKTGRYTNNAVVTGQDGLTAMASATTIVRKPVLKVQKSGPQQRFLNRVAAYTITVSNTGDAAASQTSLTDMIPDGMQLVSASHGGKARGRNVVWDLGTIGPGKSETVSLKLTSTKTGTMLNRAVAKAYCAEASAETTTVVKGIPAILLEAIDLKDPIELGNEETYLITVTNQGSANDTDIKIVCTLAAEQEYVSATGPTKATVKEKTVTFALLDPWRRKKKATYRVVVKGIKTGDVRFKVSLTSAQLKTPVEETESTHIYE